MMNKTLQILVSSAQERIQATVERYGLNSTYAAYSGGKDSEAVRRLALEMYPRMILIHNGHRGERVSPATEGVLFVKEPKAENVPLFLKTVNLKAQLDGTRRDEDKTVIFDGKEIHRSVMPDSYTNEGVFGLHVCFPLFDWKEEQVFEFLKETNPIHITCARYSYEGEGDLLGMKTVFCNYEGEQFDDLMFFVPKQKPLIDFDNAGAVYVNASVLTDQLIYWCEALGMPVTIEVQSEDHILLNREVMWHPTVRYFIVCDTFCELPCLPNLFIKVRILHVSHLTKQVEVANRFAQQGHQVLLMPEYGHPNIGEVMMDLWAAIHPNVRFMPPVQNLLGIK